MGHVEAHTEAPTKRAGGRPSVDHVKLSSEERARLEALVRRTTAPQAHVRRAKIALDADEGVGTVEIARRLSLSAQTVSLWRRRFALFGVATLADAPRSGAPRIHGDDTIATIIELTTTTALPDGSTHWSTATMAATGVSPSTLSRIWRTFGLKPHLMESFTISNDPAFTEKVRDVVGVYLNPPEAAMVLCVDETTQIQALDRTQPMLPMRPGVPLRRTTEYRRHGVGNLDAALDVASGKVITTMTKAHRTKEFVEFLELIDRRVPKDLGVHLVLDNYAAHTTEAVRTWLLCHPRFVFHVTPT